MRGHLWVPIDDENTYVYNFLYAADPAIGMPREFALEQEIAFGRGPDDIIPASGYRLKRNASNDYFIDRELQRTKTFTGIQGINTQDYALQETMEKPFVDRSRERLGTADLAIIAARQLLLEATYEVEKGRQPRGVDPDTHRSVRGCDKIIPSDDDWRIDFAEDMKAVY